MSGIPDLAEFVRRVYANHLEWAQRRQQLSDRLITLQAETASVLGEISRAEREEQNSLELLRETFGHWRDSLTQPTTAPHDSKGDFDESVG